VSGGILKGVGKITGDGWKDVTRKGEVQFVYADPLPAPYIGFDGTRQYERVGNVGWTASDRQYDFAPASWFDVLRLLPTIWKDRPARQSHQFRRARTALTASEDDRGSKGVGAKGVECEPMPAVDDDGWCEWIHPLPGYLMQCCDCGLIHEMQVAIGDRVGEGPLNEGEGDETGVVVFRMRRTQGASS
jgi:hypothetical protein